MPAPRPIFDHSDTSRQPIWQPHDAEVESPSVSSRSLACEAELIAALDAPLAPGETTRVGFDRKEREIAARFLELDVISARALLTRLAIARADDCLVAAFERLTGERRRRLQNVLADAPRRAALGRRAAR